MITVLIDKAWTFNLNDLSLITHYSTIICLAKFGLAAHDT